MGESIIGHVPYVDTPTDICTKVVTSRKKCHYLISLLLRDLCN
jgi:hypothetical protein